MKPIDKISLAKSINFIQSLTPEDKIKYCENIHQLQPHAFLTIVALMQEGLPVPMLDHGICLLMVIHHVFYSHCRSLPLITEDLLRDALEGNVAMLQSIEQGWLTHDKAISLYPERTLLTFIFGYMKDNNLGFPCKENERLISRIKILLDAYAKAKSLAMNNFQLH